MVTHEREGRRGISTATTGSTWLAGRGAIVLAVGYVWFYNGANYLAFKVAGDALHPLMVATLRYLLAGVVLLPVALVRVRRSPVPARELAGAATLGVVMLVVSQPLAIWGTHFLPAGVAAVFGSSAPLFLAVFAWAVFRRPLTRRQVAGVIVGFAGLVAMGWSSAGGSGGVDERWLAGAALTLVGSAAWAAGSLLAPHLRLPRDPVVGLTVQLIAATVVLGAIVLTSGIAAATDLARVPLAAWGALSFLIVASTLIGYAAFLALNADVSPTIANTFSYAAPVIALCLSALLLHEPLTPVKLAAGGITLVGVALMIDRKNAAANRTAVPARHDDAPPSRTPARRTR